MKIKEIVNALERFAPLPLQDDYDNAGLQIGLTDAEVTGALLCLDVTEPILDEAIALGCNLVVAHHPLIFRGCKSITGKNYIERCIAKAIKNDVAIYCAHTNLDNAPQGVSFRMADKIGLVDVKVLAPQPGENSVGAGVIGRLAEPLTELEFLKHIKKTFEVECLRHNKLTGREIETVALCGGAGAFLMQTAIDQHADVFLTGEIKYHDFFGHESDILLAEIGHYESEQFTKEIFADILRTHCPDVEVFATKLNTNPIKYL